MGGSDRGYGGMARRLYALLVRPRLLLFSCWRRRAKGRARLLCGLLLGRDMWHRNLHEWPLLGPNAHPSAPLVRQRARRAAGGHCGDHFASMLLSSAGAEPHRYLRGARAARRRRAARGAARGASGGPARAGGDGSLTRSERLKKTKSEKPLEVFFGNEVGLAFPYLG